MSIEALRKQISIVGDTLQINGTDDPDHIIIRSGGAPGFVRVKFNGIRLGAFGPVARILVQGRGGDNVIIVRRTVKLPARLEGGRGDDCLQGGSGGDVLLGGSGNDVLIAGTGRPALKTGTGSSRIVVRRRMGPLRVSPRARSELLSLLSPDRAELLRLLRRHYKLKKLRHLTRDLGQSSGLNASLPIPIIIAPDDLTAEGIVPLLQQTYAAGQAIVLVNATADQAAQLRTLLGHPNAAEGLEGGEKAALIYFRKAPRPGSLAYDYRAGIIQRAGLSASLSESKGRIIELLSRIFSATAIVPSLSGNPSDDLTQLANSYTSSMIAPNSWGSSVQLVNSVWAARSFKNEADFYYVQQEADYYVSTMEQLAFAGYVAFADNQDIGASPTLIQPSPATTQCTESTTSGVNWNIGGSSGWNQAQGVNATLTGGVTVLNSHSLTCPDTKITNASDPSTGQTHWRYNMPPTAQVHQAGLTSFVNQWVWEVPWSSYRTGGQTIITISSTGLTCFDNDGPLVVKGVLTCAIPSDLVNAELESAIPLPFGETFALEPPTVLSVTPTCVEPGASFVINGSALYPSLVTSVLISGEPLATGNYTTTSDTSIQVTAPSSLASPISQPVVVQTELAQSNSDVKIQISALCGASSGFSGLSSP